jgi:hypothetical protein
MDGSMTAPHDPTPLNGIWQQHRAYILQLGQALWQAMPEGAPPVTVHGRDLLPEIEGVGFQFQLAIRGAFYSGHVLAAYYVVQVQLARRRVSLNWLVDAMPVFEIADNDYELYAKRTHTLPLRQRMLLEHLFSTELRDDALAIFTAVRSGRALREPAMIVSSGSGQPSLPGSP